MVELPMQLIMEWLRLYKGLTEEQRKATGKAWSQAKDKVTGQHRWRRVIGPMAAVIATLEDLNWKGAEPTAWYDEAEQTWELDFTEPRLELDIKTMMNERLESQRWKQTAKHHLGEGLQQGVDTKSLQELSRQFGKEDRRGDGKGHRQGLLEKVVQGAGWPPTRRVKARHHKKDKAKDDAEDVA